MNRTLSMIAASVATMALAACATGPWDTPGVIEKPAATAPELAPSATATMKADIAIDRWWTVFGDDNLNRLIEEALAHNADLETAVGRVREAQATLDAVHAAESPTVDAQVQGGRERKSTVGAAPIPPGVGPQFSSTRAQLSVGYEVDLFGKLSAGTQAARNQLLATEWARTTVEWSLTSQVAEIYFDLAAVDRQIVISEAVRSGREATVKLRRRENEVGSGNEFDLRRAEAELTGTKATLAGLARQRVALEHSLSLLLGRTPAEIASRAVTRSAIDESKAISAVLPQGAAGDFLVRRPDVRQAEAQLAAANSSIEAARAATLPSLRLSGAVGSDAKHVSDLFTGPAGIWSIFASAAQPIIDGGRLKAQVREEHARGEQALSAYRKAVASAFLDLREAYEALDITEQAYQAQRARVAALSRARDLANLGYRSGAFSYLDLLDAERNWYQAQLDQVSAYRDQLTGQIAAFKALGGGYAATESTQAVN
jgi:multidrug efflux system outer membrane protein